MWLIPIDPTYIHKLRDTVKKDSCEEQKKMQSRSATTFLRKFMQDGCCRGRETFLLGFVSELHIARTMNHVVPLTAAASRCFTAVDSAVVKVICIQGDYRLTTRHVYRQTRNPTANDLQHTRLLADPRSAGASRHSWQCVDVEAVRQYRLVGTRISICDDHQPCHRPEHSFCLRRDESHLSTCFLRMNPPGRASPRKAC